MFGRPANPYDEVVSKATDEKQTEINWEIALTVWDKVNEDGETGARNCVQALQKRLNHRSANVQLFSLTLAGALVNNCGPALHREISGKTFTQTLVRLINDRTTHETVRRSALSTLETIIREHPNDPNFDLLLETYESLKRQGVVFPSSQPAASESSAGGSGRNGARGAEDEDEVLRREEEELQRALAESAALADPMRGFQKRGASPGRSSSSRPSEGAFAPPSCAAEPAPKKTPTRVRALFDFHGQTAEELQLRRGEEVRVLEAVSDEWWRGESTDGRGRVGIFPVNYVEPLPDLPPAPSHQPSLSSYSQPSHSQQQQPQQETEEDLEASIFAQAASIDRLLALMQTLRARGEDFAESEELTELYNSSMRLRPKVVQLLRKYEQKQADLHSLSDKVQHAKTTYEQYVGIAPPPQQQQQQQSYAQAQQNGFHPHAAQQHPLPIHQQQQQQQPPPLTAASPAPQAHPPHADPAQTEEQREYERKYAEYLRQLEEYNRQMAQIAQQQGHPPPPSSSTSAGGGPPTSQDPQAQQAYYAQHQQQQPSQAAPGSDPYAHQQQQQQQAPPPSVGSPAPQHLAQSSTSLGSPTPSAAQPPAQAQPQPVWDPSAGQWVWPAQHAHAAPPAGAAVEGGYAAHPAHPAPAPAPALSPVNVPAQGQGYSAQTVPYPTSSSSSAGGLEGGMAALSVSAGGAASPPPQGQAQAAYYPQQGQQQDEHAAAWAAWHAAQAQQQQGLGQQPA